MPSAQGNSMAGLSDYRIVSYECNEPVQALWEQNFRLVFFAATGPGPAGVQPVTPAA